MKNRSIFALGLLIAGTSAAVAHDRSESRDDARTGRSVYVEPVDQMAAPSAPALVDGSVYVEPGTATGGPSGGLH